MTDPGRRAGLAAAAARGWAQQVGGLPRVYWVLWWATLVNRTGTFIVPFLALYVTQGRNLSAATASLVLLAWGVAGMPAQPLGGLLADRFGRTRTAVGVMLVSALAMLALGAARTPATLVGAAALLGFVGEAYRPAVAALTADLVSGPDRARAFGLTFWAVNLGFAAAAVLGGWLAEVSWTLLFVGDAITTTVAALLVARLVRDPHPGAGASVPPLAGLRVAVRDRLLLGVGLFVLLQAAAYAQTQAALSLDVVDAGLTTRDFGLALAANGVVIVALQPLVGSRVAAFDPARVLAAGVALLGVGLGATAFASTLPGYLAAVVVWTLGEILAATFLFTVVADLAPPSLRARYQGVYGLAFAVAFAFGPALGTRTYAAVGDGLWLGCLLLCLLAAAWILALGPALAVRRAQTAAAEAG